MRAWRTRKTARSRSERTGRLQGGDPEIQRCGFGDAGVARTIDAPSGGQRLPFPKSVPVRGRISRMRRRDWRTVTQPTDTAFNLVDDVNFGLPLRRNSVISCSPGGDLSSARILGVQSTRAGVARRPPFHFEAGERRPRTDSSNPPSPVSRERLSLAAGGSAKVSKNSRFVQRPSARYPAESPSIPIRVWGWWAGQDSNLQPDRYERPALTIELPARKGSPRRH